MSNAQGYIFEHEGRQFTPDGTTKVPDPSEHNAKVEAAELALWATKPEHFAGYMSQRDDGAWRCTTWLGASLGTVQRVRPYQTNLSCNMHAVTILGTNGAMYYGRYGADWAQLIRLRKAQDRR